VGREVKLGVGKILRNFTSEEIKVSLGKFLGLGFRGTKLWREGSFTLGE